MATLITGLSFTNGISSWKNRRRGTIIGMVGCNIFCGGPSCFPPTCVFAVCFPFCGLKIKDSDRETRKATQTSQTQR